MVGNGITGELADQIYLKNRPIPDTALLEYPARHGCGP
jgi:hypothetical protein